MQRCAPLVIFLSHSRHFRCLGWLKPLALLVLFFSKSQSCYPLLRYSVITIFHRTLLKPYTKTVHFFKLQGNCLFIVYYWRILGFIVRHANKKTQQHPFKLLLFFLIEKIISLHLHLLFLAMVPLKSLVWISLLNSWVHHPLVCSVSFWRKKTATTTSLPFGDRNQRVAK